MSKPAVKTLKQQMMEREPTIIREALERNKWRRQATANELGISRVCLFKKMRLHKIEQSKQEPQCQQN